MCSRTSLAGGPALLLALALMGASAPALSEQRADAAGSRGSLTVGPSRDQVRQAASETRAALERPVPRQREASIREPEPDRRPVMSGLEEAMRVVVWALGAVLVVYVALRLRRWIRMRAPAARSRIEPPVPARVSGLDIAPATMPEDVGGQAAALWRDGQGRAALALLYRAALSRLVHVHGVPIRTASTEEQCVRLSAQVLPAASSAFVADLVETWRRAAYGAHLPDEPRMQALCDGFERYLPARRHAT